MAPKVEIAPESLLLTRNPLSLSSNIQERVRHTVRQYPVRAWNRKTLTGHSCASTASALGTNRRLVAVDSEAWLTKAVCEIKWY
jgi:hypothetical protein